MNIKMEKRMYFFVPYQLTGIQQGIQCGHAALEYANRFHESELFQDFVNNWKTWIVLNGGTTNVGYQGLNKGSLNQIYDSILFYNVEARLDDKIDVEKFFEPDLNDAMTAICFICDEQVFNKDLYPDFIDFVMNIKMYPEARKTISKEKEKGLKSLTNSDYKRIFPEYYEEWLELIGGPKTAFLKELTNGKKLA